VSHINEPSNSSREFSEEDQDQLL